MSTWQEREDELEHQLNRGSLWAITYGDLMSYLMLFFLLLFVGTSSRSLTVQLGAKAVEAQYGGGGGKMIQQLFSQYGVQQIAKLDVGENRIRIVFQAPVLFDSGSADLKTGSMAQMTQLAEALGEIPNSIQVEGHTDDRPLGRGSKFNSNWELSAARAFSVMRFLEISGVPPRRLSAIGYGEFRPLGSNDTPEGRTANRRIELNIIRREDLK